MKIQSIQEQIKEVEGNIYAYKTLGNLCRHEHERIRQCLQKGLSEELQILEQLKAKQED